MYKLLKGAPKPDTLNTNRSLRLDWERAKRKQSGMEKPTSGDPSIEGQHDNLISNTNFAPSTYAHPQKYSGRKKDLDTSLKK